MSLQSVAWCCIAIAIAIIFRRNCRFVPVDGATATGKPFLPFVRSCFPWVYYLFYCIPSMMLFSTSCHGCGIMVLSRLTNFAHGKEYGEEHVAIYGTVAGMIIMGVSLLLLG